MKKIMYFAALLAALTACSKPARKTFHLTGAPDLVISCDGGNALFGIEANPEDAWTLTADADWFTVNQSFGKGDGSMGTGDAVFLILSDRWTMNHARTATITVTNETRIALPEGYWVQAESPEAWLTIVNCQEGELTVKAGQNPFIDRPRETVVHIRLSDGTLLAEVTVVQNSEKKPAPVE